MTNYLFGKLIEMYYIEYRVGGHTILIEDKIMQDEKCNICGQRTAHHSDNLKKDMVSRLNRIEGQVRGISRMISEDIYCDDVLNQITSINAALNGVKKLLLEAHLKSCVTEQIKEGKTEVMDELMKTIEKMIK